jgi:dual specificity phosphatase 12
VANQQTSKVPAAEERLTQWESYGHEFKPGELEELKMSIVEMALSRVDGPDDIYVGG